MLQSVPVFTHSVRNAVSATAARRSPFAVTAGSLNFTGARTFGLNARPVLTRASPPDLIQGKNGATASDYRRAVRPGTRRVVP